MKVIEAINAIKDQFKLVLVITHIDELKEAYGACVEVRKCHDGTEITVK